jgi:hypothetical protein
MAVHLSFQKPTPERGPERGYDGVAVLTRLGQVPPQDLPRLVTIVADNEDHPHDLEAWIGAPRADGRIAVKTRPEGAHGVTPLEQRGGLSEQLPGTGGTGELARTRSAASHRVRR